jgi:hypothetical protein
MCWIVLCDQKCSKDVLGGKKYLICFACSTISSQIWTHYLFLEKESINQDHFFLIWHMHMVKTIQPCGKTRLVCAQLSTINHWHLGSKKVDYVISKLVHPTMHPLVSVLSCLILPLVNLFWINVGQHCPLFRWGSHFWWVLETKLELISFPIQFVVRGIIFFKVTKEMSCSNWHHKN